MKKTLIITLILIAVFYGNIEAQKLSSSPFSRYGVGELYFQGNGRQVAMGNTGIGDYNSYHISKINPALISSLKPSSVIFEIGLFDKLSDYQTNGDSQLSNIASFKYFMGGFRVTKWWHTSFGITPYSGIGYTIRTEDTLSINDEFSTPIISNYEGQGGINQLFWGNSFTIKRHLSIGANINYNFGSIDRINSSLINDSLSSYMSVTTFSTRNIFKKFSYNFGFVFADTIKKDEYTNILKYSIGGVFSNKYTINTLETKYINKSQSSYGLTFTDSIFFDTVANSSMMMPRTIGGGISLTFYDKFSFSADYKTSRWTNNTILGESNFANSTFMGVGAEFVLSALSTKYFKTIRYRVGAYQYNSYVVFNNQQIRSQALTFGFGFPIKTVQMNLGFVVGKTGSVDLGLQENFYEFNVGLSLYDLWFIKRKFL